MERTARRESDVILVRHARVRRSSWLRRTSAKRFRASSRVFAPSVPNLRRDVIIETHIGFWMTSRLRGLRLDES